MCETTIPQAVERPTQTSCAKGRSRAGVVIKILTSYHSIHEQDSQAVVQKYRYALKRSVVQLWVLGHRRVTGKLGTTSSFLGHDQATVIRRICRFDHNSRHANMVKEQESLMSRKLKRRRDLYPERGHF